MWQPDTDGNPLAVRNTDNGLQPYRGVPLRDGGRTVTLTRETFTLTRGTVTLTGGGGAVTLTVGTFTLTVGNSHTD